MSQNKVGAPHKRALEYYRLRPMNKVQDAIIIKLGHHAHTMFIHLLQETVTTNGYYFEYEQENIESFLYKHHHLDQKKTFETLIKLLTSSKCDHFFDAEMLKKHKILTSFDLQEGHICGHKQRDEVSMIYNYMLMQMGSVLDRHRNIKNNDIRRRQIGKSDLWEITWVRFDKSKREESRKQADTDEKKQELEAENHWKVGGLENLIENQGLPSTQNKIIQMPESQEETIISPRVNSNYPEPNPSVNSTSKDKVKISEAKQSDSFGNVPFPDSKESTTLVTPSKNSDEISNPEKKKTDPFVAVIRECYTEWTGIPYMNRSQDENRAIKEISKSLVAIIKAQNPDTELNEEQICGQLRRVCGIIFNSKNREKLPEHIKKSSEYVTIAKYLNTIITQLVPLNAKKQATEPVHRPTPRQNSPRTGQMQSISEVFGPQKVEKEPTFQHEKMEINQYTPEKLEEMTGDELLEDYQKALNNKQSFLAEMLLNVMKTKGFINS